MDICRMFAAIVAAFWAAGAGADPLLVTWKNPGAAPVEQIKVQLRGTQTATVAGACAPGATCETPVELAVGRYQARVQAGNDVGWSTWSNESPFALTCPEPPSQPADLTGDGLVSGTDFALFVRAFAGF